MNLPSVSSPLPTSVRLCSSTIPSTILTINNQVFIGCSSLQTIIVDTNNPNYSSDENGVLYLKGMTTLIKYPNGKTETTYTIPSGVTTIKEKSLDK